MTQFEYLAIAFGLLYTLTAMRLLAGIPHALQASNRCWLYLAFLAINGVYRVSRRALNEGRPRRRLGSPRLLARFGGLVLFLLPCHAVAQATGESGLLVEVTADYGESEGCGKLIGVKRLPIEGAVEAGVSEIPADLLVCVSRAFRRTDVGLETVGLAELVRGARLEIRTSGVSFPTNPPRLVAERVIFISPPLRSGVYFGTGGISVAPVRLQRTAPHPPPAAVRYPSSSQRDGTSTNGI